MIIDGKGNHVPDPVVRDTIRHTETNALSSHEQDLDMWRNGIIEAMTAVLDQWWNVACAFDDIAEEYPHDDIAQQVNDLYWRRYNGLGDAISLWDNMTYDELAEQSYYGATAEKIIENVVYEAKKKED